MTISRWTVLFPSVLLVLLPVVQSFTTTTTTTITAPTTIFLHKLAPNNNPSWIRLTRSHHHMLPPDLGSNILLSVDVFDGSSIVDPVVVSGSFWSSLQRQVLSVILGQLLAAIVFTIVASFFASQLSGLRDFVVSKFLSDTSSTNPKEFIRADSPEYQRTVARRPPDFGKLLICIAIDLAGSSSELVPILGEFTDILTAPLAATLLQNQFGGSKAVFFFEFAEEILPFTDIIPFATLCWVIDTYFPESAVAGVFQLGKFRANEQLSREAIDVEADTLDEKRPGR
ncbi:hypothetical protein IV203_020824 [Nitzschia inconspicua]|uniref:Uncharacterized protein n=1 Tax=Nitzschia inconspicua TaxID=303405 RepID=A0A9K3PDE4_9STRA|nr:hypothetical protein IV203_020824 [Nitzschia inconspicua]